MYTNKKNYQEIKEMLTRQNATLVAVSKMKPPEAIRELYDLGQRDFGENYVQELVEKQSLLPSDIRWHFIGHLQTNKVKYIAPFAHLIHGIDSLKLLKEVNKQALKHNRVIAVLLQVHIASEESKFGLDENELEAIFGQKADGSNAGPELQTFRNISINGLMGMASFSEEENQVRNEFRNLKRLFDKYKQHQITNTKLQKLSMGMSGDYQIALEEGSNMVRIGSAIFGRR